MKEKTSSSRGYLTLILNTLTAAIIILSISSCSTMSIDRQASTFSAISANRSYQLRVRSGNIALDRIIYEHAAARFGRYLQLRNNNDFNGYIDIVFSSALNGSRAGYANNILYGDAWYTNDEKSFLASYNPSNPSEIIKDGIFTWQYSVMNVSIKDISGKTYWNSRYNYKGSTDLSVFLVNTSDEAARMTLDRIVQQFEENYIVIPPDKKKDSDKKPSFALIVRSPEPEAIPGDTVQP